MNVKYLKLAPITAMMALAIFFASVGPTLAQCHVDDSDIRDDDCVLEPVQLIVISIPLERGENEAQSQ